MRSLILALILSACSTGGGDDAVQAADIAAMDAEAASRARVAASDLGSTLKEALVGSLKSEGPAAAVELCSANASGLTVEIGRKHRVKIGRSSLRLRNPGNDGPPWVRAWLKQQGERPAEGVEGLEQIVEAEGARMARLIKPMTVEAPCLVCHGPEPVEAVRPLLAAKYPTDRAIGYAVGDLRGALWVEVEIQ